VSFDGAEQRRGRLVNGLTQAWKRMIGLALALSLLAILGAAWLHVDNLESDRQDEVKSAQSDKRTCRNQAFVLEAAIATKKNLLHYLNDVERSVQRKGAPPPAGPALDTLQGNFHQGIRVLSRRRGECGDYPEHFAVQDRQLADGVRDRQRRE
jgi:hypothetical protein